MDSWITKKFRRNGIKLTRPRRLIAKYLEKKAGIFCAQELNKKIPAIDRASIYRALELMQKNNVINPVINLAGEQYYEKNNESNHHHHLVCTNCLKSVCVNCSEPEIKKPKKFKQLDHLLIFTGLCQACAK